MSVRDGSRLRTFLSRSAVSPPALLVMIEKRCSASRRHSGSIATILDEKGMDLVPIVVMQNDFTLAQRDEQGAMRYL
jgi:hypothetical protein